MHNIWMNLFSLVFIVTFFSILRAPCFCLDCLGDKFRKSETFKYKVQLLGKVSHLRIAKEFNIDGFLILFSFYFILLAWLFMLSHLFDNSFLEELIKMRRSIPRFITSNNWLFITTYFFHKFNFRNTAQKVKCFNFWNKFKQIRRKLRIRLYLLKKS